MKDKNGFTLVELLAVIVILGIIVGIAIPISNNVISNSKHKSLLVVMDEAEKFVDDQWKLNKVDPESMTDSFAAIIEDLKELEEKEFLEINSSEHKSLIEEMGLSSEDVDTVLINVDENDIPCIVIVSMPYDSKLFNSVYWERIKDTDTIIPNDKNNDGYYSKCCVAGEAQGAYNAWRSKNYGEE